MLRFLKRILEWYLGVPSAQPGQDTAWDFSFEWPWPSWMPFWAVLPVVMLLVGLVVWVYLRDALTASWKMRAGLIGLRLCTVSLLFVFLTNITLSVDGTELPVVVVMIDRSASMSLDDKYAEKELAASEKELMSLVKPEGSKASRLNLAKAILSRDGGSFLKELQQEHRLHLYEFSSTSAPFEKGEYLIDDDVPALLPLLKTRLQPDGEQTGFLTSLKRVLEDFDDSRPASIVLITDGIATAGENERLSQAAKLAENESVPLYVIAIGGDEPFRDLDLSGLLAPDVAFVNDPVTFTADLKAFGLKKEEVHIRLRRKGETRVLAERHDAKPSGSTPREVQLTYTPELEGEYDFVLEAVPLKNETNTANNSQTVHVSVRKESLRVLLADYVPRYEFRYLKHLLERQKTIKLKTILQDADEDYIREDETAMRSFPKDRKTLFLYDVIIIGDVNAELIPPDVLKNLYEYVLSGRSLIMIAGPYHNPQTYLDASLQKLLPLNVDRVTVPPEDAILTESFLPVLTPSGSGSSMLRLSNSQKDHLTVWKTLPPLYWFVEAHRLKPGAVVLLEHPTQQSRPTDAENGKVAPRPLPIIMMHRVGAGKVLFHATDELWRWRQLVGDLYYGRYWIQTIRYLCRSKLVGKARTAELETNRTKYTQGETVQFTLRFFDEKQSPIEDDGVTIYVEHSGHVQRRVKLTRARNQPLAFRGELPNAAEGSYRAWVETPAFKSSPPLCAFRVRPPERELRDRSIDPAELNALERGIHGGHYTIATAGNVPSDIPPGTKTPLNQPHSVPLWNRWELMVLFAGLLLAEWLLRKRLRLI
jgi:hypothetical protein